MQWLNDYIKEITRINADDDATEHSYRTAIENMLKATVKEFGTDLDVLQEPRRTENIGTPDFCVSAKGGDIIGYIECKKPDANLQKLIISEQLQKYYKQSDNILLTDSWRWWLLRKGKKIKDITLVDKPTPQTEKDFSEMLYIFIEAEAKKIGDVKRLAEALARRCAILCKGLEAHKSDNLTQSRLPGLLTNFCTVLGIKLSRKEEDEEEYAEAFAQFADTFAQTLVYSLLLAKLKAPLGTTLELDTIKRHIPINFAVIRDITLFLQDLSDSQYEDIDWVVDDILAIVNAMDVVAVTKSMSYKNTGKRGKGLDDADDPYIYFYENFLAAYDAKKRKSRGVYYTPSPVVKFIVRAVDDLLQRDFGLKKGFAEAEAVTALDFAAGTGTFMLEMMRTVLADSDPAHRNTLIRDHILKNFYGFELLIAPYVIAHLKLSQFLSDNGVPLKNDERINIFLTNTLEQTSQQINLPMMPELEEEANRAQKIKDLQVLVITGNPPYSAASQNKGEWISNLINDYKFLDGKPLNEKKTNIQDDYVKFIRFAQWKMEEVERGIVAIITNHGFLNNSTFCGMRKSLMDTFDALYFLDLHGNAKKKETAPDGGKDENVFDIQQGVAISLLVKNTNIKKKGVFHANLYGKRSDKYTACLKQSVETIKWKPITPASSFYLFIPHDEKAAKKYEKFYGVKEIFSLSSVGIMTRRDAITICFNESSVTHTVQDFQTIEDQELREKYGILKDSVNWKVANVQKDLQKNKGKVVKILYRPFDTRFTYYTGKSSGFHSRPLARTMYHMLAGENVGLATVRQVKAGKTWQHSLITDNLIESTFVSNKTGEITYLFPLYCYDSEMGIITKRENLNPKFRHWIDERYGKVHAPEDILGCIYAILHSPDYRKRYADSLRIDFPRIPFPDDNTEFTRLATIGNDLIKAHLLQANFGVELGEHKGTSASNLVEKIRYDEKEERLYFNKDEYFAPIPPDVFNFQIGGYQPLDKYLKSRKNKKLTLSETETIKKAANAIAFTIKKMREIDQ